MGLIRVRSGSDTSDFSFSNAFKLVFSWSVDFVISLVWFFFVGLFGCR
jgi:hypothetical protein